MNIQDILRPYIDRPTDTLQDFSEVARALPAETLGAGLADTFRSDKTADFGTMAAQLFGGSSPSQRAGLLGQLLRSVGPAVLGSLASGVLGRLNGAGAAGTVSPDAASSVTPDEVKVLASEAQKQDPGILDRIGAYYGQHPEVFKALGGAALAVALGQLAQRTRAS